MSKSKPARRKKTAGTIAAVAAILITVVVVVLSRRTRTESEAPLLFEARRGPLIIAVTQAGTIKPRESVIIKNQVEGTTTILSLVPEGTQVEAGDLLIELDASQLREERFTRDLEVQNAEAAFIQSREELEITRSQGQSEVEEAQLRLKFAKEDLKQYQEGEYPQTLKESETRITLAEEELERAREKLKWSRILHAEKYISDTEFQADELAVKKAELELDIARGDLNLLKTFKHARKMDELKSEIKQAGMAFERTERKTRADLVMAEAALKVRESEYRQQKDKLAEVDEQITATRIVAPQAGQVVYASSARSGRPWRNNDQPLSEGETVREREELIYLPTTGHMTAIVKIHESDLKKLKIGQAARITVAALPNKTFTGSVVRIAPMPDPVSIWLNPDLKVYETKIDIDQKNDELRSGMNCNAEIIVEQLDDAVYVPLQTVVKENGQHVVYLWRDNKAQSHPVSIGQNNGRMVHVMKGLEQGDAVLMAPPLHTSQRMEQTDADTEAPNDHEAAPAPQGDSPPAKPDQSNRKADRKGTRAPRGNNANASQRPD